MRERIEGFVYQKINALGNRVGFDLPYFVKNGFWMTLRQGVSSIGGLLLSIAFARLTKQEIFGQYQFILSLLSIVSILSIPGLNVALIRSVARGYDGDYKKIVKTSFLWSLLGIPILLSLGGYYYLYQSQSLGLVLMISSIFFPFFYAPNTWDSFLQGKSKFDVATKYSLVQIVINTAATSWMIFLSRDNLMPIIIIYLLSYSLFNGYYFWRSLKYVENTKKDEGTIKYGLFLTISGWLSNIVDQIDKIFIGLIDMQLLAVYIIAIKMIDICKLLIKSFFSILLPKFSKEKDAYSQKMIFSLSLASMAIVILLYIFAQNIIFMLYTDKFNESVEIFRSLVLVIPLFVANSILGSSIFATKDKDKIIKINIISPVIVLGLSFFIFFSTGSILLFVLAKIYGRQVINFIFMLRGKTK